MAGSVRLRQIREWTLGSDERLQFREHLLTEIRRESGSNTLDVVEVFASILPNNNGGEGASVRHVAADDKSGFLVEAMLLPCVGLSAGNVDGTGALGDDSFEA